MTSLPGYTMLDMPELDTSSSDSSPSSGIASIEQHEYLSNTHQYPAYIPPSYQTGYYGYLSPPNTHTPSFGYSQPISPGFAHNPDLSTQVYQAYHYGYNCNYPLPTIPPRFSATAPVSVPGRATGCVSPLDLFGNMPKQRSLPTTGWGIREAPSSLASTPSLEITVDMDEAGGSTSSLGDIDPVSPTPSVESDTCVDEAELEDNAQVEQEPQQRVEVTHGVKKQKKLLPAGGKVCLSPTMENKGEEGAVEGKEGKKRSRSAQACERCRVRKARCFGGHPCNRCIKRKFTCEFTPTKTKSVPKPEAAKPKIRRHSMHTVSSSMAPGPSIAQSDSRPGTHRAASHAHTRSVTIPNPSTHPYARPLAPAPPVYSASSSLPTPALPTSHIGLGLGLTLGLQLTPPPDDLDAGGDEVPEMSPSSTLYSSDPLVSEVATRWSTSAEPRTNETHAPTMLVEEDIFQFSPHQNASNLTVNGWIPGVDLDGFASNSDGYGSGDSQLDTIMGRSNHMMYGLTSDWGAHPMASRA